MTEGLPIKVHEDGARYIEVPASAVVPGYVIRAQGSWRKVKNREDGETEVLRVKHCIFTFEGNSIIETRVAQDTMMAVKLA